MLKEFDPEQQSEFDKQTFELLTKINSVRTTPDKPVLKKEDCVYVRNLSQKSLNYHSYILCPNDPNNSLILEQGIKSCVYVKLRDTSDVKKLPLGKEGDKFNISVIGGPNGEIILKDGVPVWSNNNQPVYKPGEIDKNRGRNCAIWYESIYTESKYDANCCFTFLINKQQQLICETSPFCIQRAKKLMNFTLSTCHANFSVADKLNSNPGYIPEKPFYKNPDTKN